LFGRLIDTLKWARAPDKARLHVYAIILTATLAVMFLGRLILSRDLIDPQGVPIGADFMSFYAASKLALGGDFVGVWTPAAHQAAQNAIFGKDLGYWAFFYPPPYLFICWPLGLLPYGWALLVWTLVPLITALAVMSQVIKQMAPDIKAPVFIMAAFPALWVNLMNGQNASLSLTILGLGFLLLDKRPWLAGAVLGLMIIKPQLAIILPFVLAASGRWRSFVACGGTAFALLLGSYVWVGPEAFQAFLANSQLARQTLEDGLVEAYKMPTLFGAVKMSGASTGVAYLAHGVWAVSVILITVWAAFRYRPDGLGLGALSLVAALLVSPFLLDYDLLISALPLAWLVMQGLKSGFRAWEVTVSWLLVLAPLGLRSLGLHLGLPLGPLVYGSLLMCIILRMKRQTHIAQQA
jgi:alpha-1,2-mannosyltransferase